MMSFDENFCILSKIFSMFPKIPSDFNARFSARTYSRIRTVHKKREELKSLICVLRDCNFILFAP